MKLYLSVLISTIYLSLFAQDCGLRYQTEIFDSVSVSTVDYGLASGQTLQMDIYEPLGDSITDRPVIVFCFGGSFIAGDRTSTEIVAFATDFAKRGYVCASIDYRLASNFLALFQEENVVKTVFRAVQDGKAAIRYFRKNASNGNSLGIDSNQIFIGGTSAGGILGINLAYADDTSEFSSDWKTWAQEIGGIEGDSGNPGYCSKPSGVFGFAGAVADTLFMDSTDVPFYGCHATGDQTVLYNYGPPLNPAVPVSLYGSGLVETRLDNLGIYNVLDTYSGSDHPPLGGTNYTTTLNNFSGFLYNILDCNPNNLKKSDQKSCYSMPVDTSSIDTTLSIINLEFDDTWSVFPNPSYGKLTISSEEFFTEVLVIDVLGRSIFKEYNKMNRKLTLDLIQQESGVYFVKILVGEVLKTKRISIK